MKKHYKEIGKCLDKIESVYLTEIQRQLDILYQISNRLYEEDFNNQKEKKLMRKEPQYVTKRELEKSLKTIRAEMRQMAKDMKEKMKAKKKKAKKK